MKNKWNFWAKYYDKLWVQKFVLKPSRVLILNELKSIDMANKKILDLGCGIGELCKEISYNFPDSKILGIDTSNKMIERAQNEFISNSIEYKNIPIDSLQNNEQFDIIISTNAFPYIPNKPNTISIIENILKPNGLVLILHANSNTFYDILILSIVKLTTTKAEYLSVKKLKKLLTESKLKVKSSKPIKSLFFIPSVNLVISQKCK